MAVLIRPRAAPRALRRGPSSWRWSSAPPSRCSPGCARTTAPRARLIGSEARAALERPGRPPPSLAPGLHRVITTRLDGQTMRVSFFDGREDRARRRGVARTGPSPASTATRRATCGWAARSASGHRARRCCWRCSCSPRLRLTAEADAATVDVAALVCLRRAGDARQRAVSSSASVVAACVPLAYLAAALPAASALRAPERPFSRAADVFLFDGCRAACGRLCVARCRGVAWCLLSIPGGLVSDVAFASMAGATELLHGALPYGNLAQNELVHGDTYPLLAYRRCTSRRRSIAPVRDGFDNLDGALWVATAFALAAAMRSGAAVPAHAAATAPGGACDAG